MRPDCSLIIQAIGFELEIRFDFVDRDFSRQIPNYICHRLTDVGLRTSGPTQTRGSTQAFEHNRPGSLRDTNNLTRENINLRVSGSQADGYFCSWLNVGEF